VGEKLLLAVGFTKWNDRNFGPLNPFCPGDGRNLAAFLTTSFVRQSCLVIRFPRTADLSLLQSGQTDLFFRT
jgi:hypothetical protein